MMGRISQRFEPSSLCVVQSWVLEEKYKNLADNDAEIDTVLEDAESTQFKSYLIEELQFTGRDKAPKRSRKCLIHVIWNDE